MRRGILTAICLLLIHFIAFAEGDEPIIEIKADRTYIYPQRMDLTGEESLMDVLLLVPDLMIAGYEDVISNYNLRIDNCPMNGDNRLILSQMKAKDIARIQVCDNTGVAKGTIGMGRVLDINMKMPEALSGFVEGQGGFGGEMSGIASANALYGSQRTDLYANASYRYQGGNREYLTLHMTNRFDDRNRLLTYFTQQYLGQPSGASHKVMGRARYFHRFNEQGTELLLVGGYQYSTDPALTSELPLFIAELNTPLLSPRLSMTLGVEGDYLLTRHKGRGRSWDIFNHDIYLQFSYTLPKWRFTAGTRVMFYHYQLKDAGVAQRHADIRDNASACVIFVPDNRSQVQLGYYRKFYNPAFSALFMDAPSLSDEEWAVTRGQLAERTIDQVKLSYAFSRQRLTVQTEASYYAVRGQENFVQLGASAYWKTKGLTLTGGANVYLAGSGAYASLRLAPVFYLPCNWQIGAQVVYYTRKSPIRAAYDVPVYGCLSVNKQFGKRWNLGVDWHDMAGSRHGVQVRLQYRFSAI
jgi:hypothetical protein